MKTLTEQDLLQVTGGVLVMSYVKNAQKCTKAYTLLAQLLNQKQMSILEATHYYEHLGHALGEWLYTTLHPESDI